MKHTNLLGKSLPKKLKCQSAMEYLMTYGWAILIIAVVLGVLFSIGFFNSANIAPKVTAGSCQVYRPEGPGTTAFIALEGTCQNEQPQYVAQFSGSESSNINLGANDNPSTGSFTISFWEKSGPSTKFSSFLSNRELNYVSTGLLITQKYTAPFGALRVQLNTQTTITLANWTCRFP